MTAGNVTRAISAAPASVCAFIVSSLHWRVRPSDPKYIIESASSNGRRDRHRLALLSGNGLRRRTSVHWTQRVALALLAAFAAEFAAAQPFPSRALRIIVPVPPGGGVDFLSRALGQKVADSVGV